MFSLVRKSTIWSHNNDYSLQIAEVKVTGLLFSDLHLLPFLKIGILFAFFHSIGTIPFCIYKLNAIDSGTLISSTISYHDPCSEVDYTFCSKGSGIRSLIDHFILSDNAMCILDNNNIIIISY